MNHVKDQIVQYVSFMVIALVWYVLKPILQYVFGEFCGILCLFFLSPFCFPPPIFSSSLERIISFKDCLKKVASSFYQCSKEIKKVSAVHCYYYISFNTSFKLKFPNTVLKIKQHKQ